MIYWTVLGRWFRLTVSFFSILAAPNGRQNIKLTTIRPLVVNFMFYLSFILAGIEVIVLTIFALLNILLIFNPRLCFEIVVFARIIIILITVKQ